MIIAKKQSSYNIDILLLSYKLNLVPSTSLSFLLSSLVSNSLSKVILKNRSP
jgi:hypothetical protein